MKSIKLSALAIAIVMTMGAGCNDHSSNTTPVTQEQNNPDQRLQVSGLVLLDEPISGATITVKDESGKQLLQMNNATDAQGFYTVYLPGKLENFTVEVTAGRYGNESFDYALAADVDGFSQDTSAVYINAATTLASTYRHHAKISKTQADAAVKQLLNLPEMIDLGFDLSNPALTAFNQKKFMQVAAEQGGFNQLIDKLVSILNQPEPHSPYDFSIVLLQGGFDSVFNSLKDIVTEVGKSAVTPTKSGSNTDIAIAKMGFDLVGSAISAISATGGQSDDRSKEILEKLDVQNTKLNQMSSQIINLQTNLNAISEDIKRLEKIIVSGFNITNYNNKISSMNDAINHINANYRTYVNYSKKKQLTANEQNELSLFAYLVTLNMPAYLDKIHSEQMGGGGAEGTIQYWHKMVSDVHRNGENDGNYYPFVVNDKYFDQLNEQFEYFYALQVRGLTMLVDAYKYLGKDEEAEEEYEFYKNKLEEQEKLLYSRRIQSGLLVSPLTNTMFSAEPACTADSCITFITIENQKTIRINNLISTLNDKSYKGYRDWQLPNSTQLLALGKNGVERSLSPLIVKGFKLDFIRRDSNGLAAIWSSETETKAGNIYPVALSVMEGLSQVGPIMVDLSKTEVVPTVVIPSRPFGDKKDTYAGTIESNKITN
ncbi:hypothetical protein ACF3NA_04540 [Alkanindiges sp. WGS2144]|uniref:hypothetical protein n=1 Tax=Alkanindiges sp. WGS2144 TaxID=3366808 RepID=UPI0037512ECC